MYRELTMMEVREVLRRLGAGQSQRRIGRETGLGRNTIGRYVKAAAEFCFAAGEPCEELVAAVARAVQERPLPEPSEQRTTLATHRLQIERWLADGLKLTKVIKTHPRNSLASGRPIPMTIRRARVTTHFGASIVSSPSLRSTGPT